MSRIRTVKPEFWTSEQVAECSAISRLLFIGMWNFCDDSGIHPASIKRIKMEVFPGDSCTLDQVQEWIGELSKSGLIETYSVGEVDYWRVTGWKHQRIDNPSYKYPLQTGRVPVADKSPTGRRKVADEYADPTPRKGREGNGVDEEETTGADAPTFPDGLNLDAWNRWEQYRKEIRKPLKPASIPAAQKSLAAFGIDQFAVVEQSIANGYQGIFPLKNQKNGAKDANIYVRA